MQTCNCVNTCKYNNECVICGALWETKTLDEYILELKKIGEEIRVISFQSNDLNMRNKYCLIREIYTELECIAKANANLIAAAPDMFEALLSIENDDGTIPEAIWELRNNAIAKALGEP